MKGYFKLLIDNEGEFEYSELEVSLAQKLVISAKSVTENPKSKLDFIILLRSLYTEGISKQDVLKLLKRTENTLKVDERWFTTDGFSLALDSCKNLTGFSKEFIASALIYTRILVTGLAREEVPMEANFYKGKWLDGTSLEYFSSYMEYFPEPITGANALNEYSYASYNGFSHEVHCSYGLPTKSFLCSTGYCLIQGRPLKEDELTVSGGLLIVSPFWALYDLFYSQSDDTAITETLEFFQYEGILDDFIAFCKEEGMHQEVLDYNLNMFLYGQSGLPLPSIMEYRWEEDILGFL